MKKSYLKLLCTALSLIVLLSACSGGAASVSPTPDQSLSNELILPSTLAPSEPSISEFPVTVTDHLGREVTIEVQPERLVSGYYITTSLVIALGLADRLVGVEARAERFPVYSLAAPDILELPNVGSAKEFDLEGCAALRPDLVILPVRLSNAISALEDLGIAVIGVDPEDKMRMLETIELVSAATGSQTEGARLSDYIAEKSSELSDLTSGLERPEVYFAGNSAYLSTAGSRMYQHSLIEAAGAENVAAGIEDTYWAEISYEQLIAWNPEIVIIAPGAEYSLEELISDPALADLDAVKNNRVYRMPSQTECWDAPLPSSVLGSLWLASILHAEVYSPDDFTADYNGFYGEFYDIVVDAGLEK